MFMSGHTEILYEFMPSFVNIKWRIIKDGKDIGIFIPLGNRQAPVAG